MATILGTSMIYLCSFSNMVTPYLILTCTETHAYILRYLSSTISCLSMHSSTNYSNYNHISSITTITTTITIQRWISQNNYTIHWQTNCINIYYNCNPSTKILKYTTTPALLLSIALTISTKSINLYCNYIPPTSLLSLTILYQGTILLVIFIRCIMLSNTR